MNVNTFNAYTFQVDTTSSCACEHI